MKKFMLLHCGFQNPTPEIMQAWNAWMTSLAGNHAEHGGFSGGREITRSGTRDLPWNMESTTGYSIIEAENFDAAERIARSNPFIAGIRVYELRSRPKEA